MRADEFNAAIRRAPGADYFWSEFKGLKFSQRQVAAAAVQVLTQVAQNVCQLKRNTALHRQLDGVLSAVTPNANADQANGARDLVTKFAQLGPCLKFRGHKIAHLPIKHVMKVLLFQAKLLAGLGQRDQRGRVGLRVSIQRRVGGVAVGLQALIAFIGIAFGIVHQIIGLAHPCVHRVHGPAFFRRR